MGNNKFGITAEFISIIRSKNDRKNSYFVSPKTQKIYNFVRKIISENKLKEIFDWRLSLSKIIDEKIREYQPEQILELGAGYSLRGLNLCLKNKDLIYIDSDLENVIFKKIRIMQNICQKENITPPRNFHLVSVDALDNNIYDKVKNLMSKDKKTLVLAEGLTTYFTDEGFRKFLTNIAIFLHNFANAEFYSNENFSYPKGIIYNILRKFIAIITGTKMPRKFKSADEFKEYLKKLNANYVTNVSVLNPGFLFYSINS